MNSLSTQPVLLTALPSMHVQTLILANGDLTIQRQLLEILNEEKIRVKKEIVEEDNVFSNEDILLATPCQRQQHRWVDTEVKKLTWFMSHQGPELAGKNTSQRVAKFVRWAKKNDSSTLITIGGTHSKWEKIKTQAKSRVPLPSKKSTSRLWTTKETRAFISKAKAMNIDTIMTGTQARELRDCTPELIHRSVPALLKKWGKGLGAHSQREIKHEVDENGDDETEE